MSDKPYAIGRDFNFERFLARIIELNRRPLDEETRKIEMSKLCLDMARTDAERREAKEMIKLAKAGRAPGGSGGASMVHGKPVEGRRQAS
jgi:hypothetical protein